MGAKKTQIILVLGALVLFVLLFILPKIEPAHSADDGHGHAENKLSSKVGQNASLDVYLNLAVKKLELTQKTTFDEFQKLKLYDSLVTFWDRLKRPDLAAWFTEEQAKKLNQTAQWERAGNRYYYAVQFVQDQTEIPVLYQRAMFCFERTLQLNPANTDAKIMLAACYVDGSDNPMEGVNRLKAIEKTDSNNLKLQLTFALFSVKSGQLDKAIGRFNKVLSIDSTYIEAYLHLADAYEKQNETEKTISMLEMYAVRTNDPTARIEINKYIQQLRTKN